MFIMQDESQRWFPMGTSNERSSPVYSVGDSVFQASIINEKVPYNKKHPLMMGLV